MAGPPITNPVFASCNVSIAPLRREASHRSEQVSQLLFGERAEVLEGNEEQGWARIRCEWDGYEGWCRRGQLQTISAKEFRAEKRLINISANSVLQFADGQINLPPGAELTNAKKSLNIISSGPVRFKGKKADVVKLAFSPEGLLNVCRQFLHVPYQWGGRTTAGIDCSGLVQVAYKLCGLRMLRDASQQASTGTEVHFLQEAGPGDIAFFDNPEGRINHVGILIDRQSIIHATDSAGRVVIDTLDVSGIISNILRKRTHHLRVIRRIDTSATLD